MYSNLQGHGHLDSEVNMPEEERMGDLIPQTLSPTANSNINGTSRLCTSLSAKIPASVVQVRLGS